MRELLIVAALVSVVTGTAAAASYNFVKPEAMKMWLDTRKPVIVVDIQVPDEFAKHHLPGSVETNAYPVKSDDDKKRLNKALARINASRDDVVIVCPRGGGGAKAAYDYLKSNGVEEKRLYILEKGIAGWPYPEASVSGR